MPNMTGHFTGTSTMQTNISLRDTPQHEMSLMEIMGLQTVSDDNWKDAKMTYWGSSDLIRGNGQQRGYFVNEHPNGDCDYGTFEGEVSNVNGQITIEGTWKYTHGTGKFAGITGNGKFKGRMTSPT